MKLVCALILTLLINSLSSEVKTINYTGVNGSKQNFEIFTPKNHKEGSKASCVIFFHGGGWSGGSLNQFRKTCAYFASRGMVSITANYSMYSKEAQKSLSKGESKKRICVMDGKSVIRWVVKNADSLGVDTEKIVVGGASAGGHISLMSMLDKKYSNPKDPKINIDIKGCLLFCPAFTLLARDRTPDVNVFNNLSGSIPPMLFLVGEKDGWEKASSALLQELSAKKVAVEYWRAKNEGHMFHGKKEWKDLCLLKADEFLVSLKLLKGQSNLVYEGSKSLEAVSVK